VTGEGGGKGTCCVEKNKRVATGDFGAGKKDSREQEVLKGKEKEKHSNQN